MPPLTCFNAYGIQGQLLALLLDDRMAAYRCSGEINYRVNDTKAMIQAALTYYAEQCLKLDTGDGISLENADLRMNFRSSNTEPLLRLDIEAQADSALVDEQVQIIESVIRGMSEAIQVRVL